MTIEEAGKVLAVLLAGYPGQAMDTEATSLYASELALLHNYDVAMVAAREWIRGSGNFPAIAWFRQQYRAVNERWQHEQAQARGLPEPPRETAVPEWVHVWWWARNTRVPRDDRVLPQQLAYYTAEHEELPVPPLAQAGYETLRVEWLEAGGPHVQAARVLSVLAGAAL